MIEAVIFVIITSSLWMVANQFTKRQQRTLPAPSDDDRQSLSVIAEGGLYQITTPQMGNSLRAFRELHLIDGGVRLLDNLTKYPQVVDFNAIQWVSAVTFPHEGIASISIHLEIQHQWRILTIQIPESDMTVLVNVLQAVVSRGWSNIGRLPALPIGPLPAFVTEDTLQGEMTIGAEVILYLLPHMLVVLQGDVVQAKLNTSSIRRVLSVERVSGRLDNFISSKNPDGVIRLYSLHETIAFALPQYRELAEEISYLSRCPVEFITQHDKTSKY